MARTSLVLCLSAMSYQALGFTPQNAPRSVVAPPTSRQAVDAMSPEDEDPKLTSILVDLKWYESTSRTIDASQMPGVLAPVSVPGENFWDPFGLTTSISDNQLRWYRAAEIKHGRVCMLAFTGWFYQSVCHLTLAGPVSLSEGVSFQDLDKLKFYDQVACRAEDCPVCDDFSSRRTVTVTAPPQSRASQQRRGSPPSHHQPLPVICLTTIAVCSLALQWDAMPLWGRWKILSAIAALEFYAESRTPHYVFGSRAGCQEFWPFNLKFDKLAEKPEKLKIQQTKEIQNGRLAMLGVASLYAAHYIPGSVPVLPVPY